MVPFRRPARGTKIGTTAGELTLDNGQLALSIARDFGPRIIGFALTGGSNAFVDLGDMGIGLPDGRTYRLRGGHRLWVAPEVPEITYEPDNDPVDCTATPDGMTIQQTASQATGVEKRIEVKLEGGVATVSHFISNRGNQSIDVAPWAITQLPPGGTAIVPLNRVGVDSHHLQPNASVVVWPYTGIDDDPFVMRERLLLLDGARSNATKIGTSLDRGWLAYAREGLVFVKRATHKPGGRYLDRGASGQCYSNSDFLELETLGERVVLGPGETVSHIETWELHRVDVDLPPQQIPEVLDLDGGSAP